MSTKKHYYCMFNDILVTTDENINNNTEPNLETISALKEAEQIAKDPSVKRYTDLDELFSDLKQPDFDAMMQAGYEDALANCSEDADAVFTTIRQRIVKQRIERVYYGNDSQNNL